MGIVGRLARNYAPAAQSPTDDFWYQPIGVVTSAGVQVSEQAALSISTFLDCVAVLSEDVAKLSLPLYERVEERRRRRATENALYRTLHDMANPRLTAYDWREMMVRHVLLRGHAYSEIIRLRDGSVELYPLHPDRVRTEQLQNGDVRYYYRDDPNKLDERVLSSNRVFHLTGKLGGLSMVEYMAQSIGVAFAQREHAARVFSQGTQKSVVLQHPGTGQARLSTTAWERVRSSWQEQNAGLGNAHKPVILEEGMTANVIGMTAEEAQLLEARRFSREEIADFFRIQHHKVGILDHATFTNVESENLNYYTDTLLPWLVKIEQTIARDLILDNERYYAEFLVDTILRADSTTRHQSYATGIQWRYMTPNEVRERENLDPVPGGDVFMQPANMAVVEADGTVIPTESGNSAPPAAEANQHHRLLAYDAAARTLRRETNGVLTAAKHNPDDAEAFMAECQEFYGRHVEHMVEALHVERSVAAAYCERHIEALRAGGVAAMDGWEDCATELARMMTGEEVTECTSA